MDTKTNPREFPPEAVPYPLQSYLDEAGMPRFKGSWGWFGWEGACVDTAIALDSVEAMQFCIDNGFVNTATDTTLATPLRRLCESQPHLDPEPKRMRAPKCAELLAKLGYPA